MILVYVPGITGDCQIPGFDGSSSAENKQFFTVSSFTFGVQREMEESAKSGTADLNIGVGELQECTMSKSMDSASIMLARKAISGSSVGTAEVKFVEAITLDQEKSVNVVYLRFKLDNAFVKSWSISGDSDGRPTEDVALWYNKIAFHYYASTDGKKFTSGGKCEWDHVTSKPWSDSGIEGACEAYNTSGGKENVGG
ncbi:MAG: type VI secretion system tube protein Hcp [Pirellulales bacterium]